MSSKWQFEEVSRNVHVLRCDTSGFNWEQWVLLTSDVHFDSTKCRRDLLGADFEEAVERDAPIFNIGDWFDAMQGKSDRRSSKSSLRPELVGTNYLDRLVSDSGDWNYEYKENLALLARGNHENSVLEKLETDLTERLAERLRSVGGIARSGGYGGWVRLLFQRPGGSSQSKRMFYFHGHGGGGPVTQGAIDFNRYGSWVANADLIVSGHIHRQMQLENMRYRLNEQNQIVKEPLSFLRACTYKEEDENAFGGWHTEKGLGPRPLGGWWIRFYKCKDGHVKWQVIKTAT